MTNNNIVMLIPIYNNRKDDIEGVEAWVDCPNVCKKIKMIYKPNLDCSIAFANAGSDYIRTRVMVNGDKEVMLISLKQKNEVILPKGVDFTLESFVWKDKNEELKELPYKILILDEEV